MSSLVIFLKALIAVTVSLNIVDGAPSSTLDIDTILDIFARQQQQQNLGSSKHRLPNLREESTESDSDSDSDDDFSNLEDSDDSDYNRYARLKKDKIIGLIEKVAANEKTNRYKNDDPKVFRKEKPNYAKNNYVSRNEKNTNSQRSSSNNIQTQILEQLLNKAINEEERKRKPRADYPKKKMKPNRLTPKLTRDDLRHYKKHNNADNGLEDYSKVYIVLNPQAVRNSNNKNGLSELVSKVLSLSSPLSKKDSQGKKKPRRYKGFVVKDDRLSRRSRHESKEMYAPRDSVDDEYKHKRNGGAATGGRTAIPYIRHRGDIYERDN